MGKFRLLCGNHIEGVKDEKAHGGIRTIQYIQGDIVETDKDLKKFNRPGISQKFEELAPDSPLRDLRKQGITPQKQAEEMNKDPVQTKLEAENAEMKTQMATMQAQMAKLLELVEAGSKKGK